MCGENDLEPHTMRIWGVRLSSTRTIGRRCGFRVLAVVDEQQIERLTVDFPEYSDPATQVNATANANPSAVSGRITVTQ